jgi:predicted dehydrogenase
MNDSKQVLVVGTGSIGKRHIANLLSLGANVSAFSYRAYQDTAYASSVRLVNSLSDADTANFDALIIANCTHQHISTAIAAAKRNQSLYIEKPLSLSLQNVQELQYLVAQHQLVVEAGFMLRCHPNLLWIKQFLLQETLGEVFYVRASVGQWLPDWRPGTDYRQGYAGFRRTGGGVIFDLIHEIDLVQWLAGPVDEVNAMTRHVKQLAIETEAIAQIGLRLKSGVLAQIHLDYVRPSYGRSLEIVGEKGVLQWDFIAGTVEVAFDGKPSHVMHKVAPDFERNHMFLAHMNHFLSRLSTPTLPAISSLNESISALRTALACHLSATERRSIRPSDISSTYTPE